MDHLTLKNKLCHSSFLMLVIKYVILQISVVLVWEFDSSLVLVKLINADLSYFSS